MDKQFLKDLTSQFQILFKDLVRASKDMEYFENYFINDDGKAGEKVWALSKLLTECRDRAQDLVSNSLHNLQNFDEAGHDMTSITASLTSKDVQQAMDLLKKDPKLKNSNWNKETNTPQEQLAQSLKTYQDRGEFDGSLQSAIDCLREAAYEITASASPGLLEKLQSIQFYNVDITDKGLLEVLSEHEKLIMDSNPEEIRKILDSDFSGSTPKKYFDLYTDVCEYVGNDYGKYNPEKGR